jgi:hypothetical protein
VFPVRRKFDPKLPADLQDGVSELGKGEMLLRRCGCPSEHSERGIKHDAQREVGSPDSQGSPHDLAVRMRVGAGEEEMENFSNTRPDVTKVITEALHPVSGRDPMLPHSSHWRNGVWGMRWGAGGGVGRGGMNFLRLLVNQMGRRCSDQSNPHSARSADVSRRQGRQPHVRGRKDRYCLHAGSRIVRLSAEASRWDSAMWKIGLALPDR